LKLSVCIETIFTRRPLLERLDSVAESGLPAFEIWGWKDKDLAAIMDRKEHHGLEIVNLNLDPPVCLLDGDAIPAFVRGVRESCHVARQLGCRRMTVHVQDVPHGAGEPWYSYLGDGGGRTQHRVQRDNIVRALKEAAPIAEDEGITLLLEPLNTLVDHAGYFIGSSQEGFEIIQEVGGPAIRLLFDAYHMQINEGNLISNLTGNIGLVGHIHLADVPGRHEPGTGEIDFTNVLSAARRAGYDGYVGLEYVPGGDDVASLQFIRRVVDQVNRGEEG